MKKNLAIIIAFAIAFAMAISWVMPRDYHKTCVVSAVEGNVISVIDSDGEEWAFYGDGYEVGDNLRVLMNQGHIIGVAE